MPAGEAVGELHRAVRRAGDMHAGRHRAGHERGELLVPHRLAVEMAGQMHRRIPAARHRERVALDLRRAAVASITSIASTPRPPWTCDTRAPVITLMPSALNSPGRLGARVDHRRDLDAGGVRIGRGAPAVVIVGEDRDAPPRRRGVAVDVGAHRARQHHAGAVIVAERDHALERAGGQHRALRHDLPVPLARLVLRRHRHMIVDALDRGVLAVIEHAGHRRAAHDAHLGQRGELGLDLRGPFGARLAVDLVSLGEQPPAEPEILVGQDHARAGAAGRERRHQTRPAPPPITSTSQCAKAFS